MGRKESVGCIFVADHADCGNGSDVEKKHLSLPESMKSCDGSDETGGTVVGIAHMI